MGTACGVEYGLAEPYLGVCWLCLTHPVMLRMSFSLSLGLCFMYYVPEEVLVISRVLLQIKLHQSGKTVWMQGRAASTKIRDTTTNTGKGGWHRDSSSGC